MATTAEGRRRHFFQIDYDNGWTIGELRKWLDDAVALGAAEDTKVRYRSKGTLGPSGFAGLEVLLPLPARGAGLEPDSLVSGSASEGGDPDGETPT